MTEKLLFVIFCFFLSSFSLLFFVVFLYFFAFPFGGFKGQVRWPEGPPHLALNPPFWGSFFVLFVFVLVSLWKKKQFLPQEGHFCLFSRSPFVSP